MVFIKQKTDLTYRNKMATVAQSSSHSKGRSVEYQARLDGEAQTAPGGASSVCECCESWLSLCHWCMNGSEGCVCKVL